MRLKYVVATLVPHSGVNVRRGPTARVIPSRIDLGSDGSAVAWYGDAPLLSYESLEALLAVHDLTHRDFASNAADSDIGPPSTVRQRAQPAAAQLSRSCSETECAPKNASG